MWPRSGTSKLVDRGIALVLVASIVGVLDGGWLVRWTALVPSRIWHGEIWRLVTWPLIAGGPVSLILTCASIYKFGGELAPRWGELRLRRFVTEIVIVAALATSAVATLAGVPQLVRHGGWAIADLLVIGWARQYPTRTLALYGLVDVRGRDLVRLTIVITVLYAIYASPIVMAPELMACAVAAVYPADRLQR
jgi:membrane associated rhomboid family serine protease